MLSLSKSSESKGESTFKSSQRFSPFTHAGSSVVRSRRHLRTRSENSVVRYNGTHFDLSTQEPVINQDGRNNESCTVNFEYDRNKYVATSPARELTTLNRAILNSRKWLERKQESLEQLLNSCGEREALIKKLVAEADHQQQAVDVLLKRGCHYLLYNTSNTVKADLEDFLICWNSYKDKLRCNKESSSDCLQSFKTPQLPPANKGVAVLEDQDTESQDIVKVRREVRNHIAGTTLLPIENNKGWLHVPGEGVFTPASHLWQRTTQIINGRNKHIDSCLSADNPSVGNDPNKSVELMESAQARGEALIAAAHLTMPGPRKGLKPVDSLLGKRSNEVQTEQLDYLRTESSVVTPSLQSGLTASEESLNRELDAIREANQSFLNVSEGELSFSFLDSSIGFAETEAPAEKSSINREEMGSPTGPKRRRMNVDAPAFFSNWSENSSLSGTPTSSPAGTLPRDFKLRYTKDALWKAIESNYEYLMDKEIIETCQLTESDLSHDEEFMPNVSFTEFLKQYQELTDWLSHVQRATQRTVTSLSEKYLNQAYHEEMLEWSPKREYLNKYAHQLALLYPSQRNQVFTRMQTLNNLWQVIETVITPQQGIKNVDCMLQDLECDLAALRRWLNATETCLLPMTIRADWTNSELEERLKHHQLLQQDIESHSRIVSAVLKLSEKLENDRLTCSCDPDNESLQLVALNLQKRWHGIWLQSLEWQCRLEEAINRRKGLYGSGFNFSSFNLPSLDESFGAGSDLDLNAEGSIHNSSSGSLIELSDDSLLFIGTRSDCHLGDSLSFSGALSSSQGSNASSPLTSALTRFLDRSSGDSANISEAESRMGDIPPDVSYSRVNLSLSLSSDGEADHEVSRSPLEPKDIGYSSESQSNDETETMQQQIALEYRYAGLCEVASDSPLGEKVDIPPQNGICPEYYRMTLVDIDSTDKTTDDGSATDDRTSPAHLHSLKQSGESPGLLSENAADDVEDIVVKLWLESSDEADAASGGQITSSAECIHHVGSMSESDSATETQEKIKYLIDHAEDLVKTSPPRSTVPGSPERRPSPSKQTQTVCTSTSSVESSCDASGEESDDSGAEEFSTATDDADETLFDSVINLNSTSDSRTSQEDVQAFVTAKLVIDSAQLRKHTGQRGNRKERPWSVVEFEELKEIDFRPLSTSESAIDSLRNHTDTDTNLVSHFLLPSYASTFPRQNSKDRKFRRAFSSCDQSGTHAARRRLKYSSSSTTDSQATKIALSTEDEDNDRTLLFDSIENMRFQGHLPSSNSESESSDEYETAPMDEMMTSADEDPHNSTGSFSENAWDNYQPMYPTASEDATEEPLHWEPSDDLEFDDEFQLTRSSTILRDVIRRRSVKEELKVCNPGECEDSDSDMDDFHCVLDDSEAGLKTADHSLRKIRKNPMDTGLAEKPGIYREILETCNTNITCLKTICEHLSSEDIGIGDVQRVQDLLYQWEKLQALASERHQQAQQLSAASKTIAQMKYLLHQADQSVTVENFSTKEELHVCLLKLKLMQGNLENQQHSIEEHQQMLDSFAQHHPHINVEKYVQEFASLEKFTHEMKEKVSANTLDLEKKWEVWCQYLEEQKELDTMTAAARDRLLNLLCQRETGHRLTKKTILKELETLQEDLSQYEARLSLLQAMRKHLTHCSNDDAQRTILATLADLRNQLLVASKRCREMYRDAEENELIVDDLELGHMAVSAAAFHESRRLDNSLKELHNCDVAAEAHTASSSKHTQGTAWSWLRSLPVQIVALMMLAGLVYVFDPDLLSTLSDLSIAITPELKHINGPPPL